MRSRGATWPSGQCSHFAVSGSERYFPATHTSQFCVTWAVVGAEVGDKVGEVTVDRRLHGPVMSYLSGGKQYIAIAGGRFDTAEMISFALPD